jgi:hypothetical protein
MTEDTIIGKVFEGRVIDRVVEIAGDLIEIGFTDHSFERVHNSDFASFCEFLGVGEETIVVTQEILDENPVLVEAGVQVGDVGFVSDDMPEVTEPEVTEPEVTEPEVTEPEVTEPEVTQ